MRLIDDFRDPGVARRLERALHELTPEQPVRFMEICGTHTMAMHRNGLHGLLPPAVTLVSGPGCPVCVTDQATIDRAIAYAREPDVHLAVFGDMLRVPGSHGNLEEARARGGRVTVVTSPLEALAIAEREPDRLVVFFAIGFETTAPGVAALVQAVARRGVPNVAALCSLKLVPPAMVALATSGDLAIDGFLCPGHVSVVIGADAYTFLSADYRRPCVIAGFEPLDMLLGIYVLLCQLRDGRCEVENAYGRVVSRRGNQRAQALMDDVFEPADVAWRGLGVLPGSGLGLRPRYAGLDVERRRPLDIPEPRVAAGCICGAVLRGAAQPEDCKIFGTQCTPETPVGPCMVSSEGTCAAHLRYARRPASAAGRQRTATPAGVRS